MAVDTIRMEYTNYRGETGLRDIGNLQTPRWAATEFHPEPQYIIRAWDYHKAAWRDFALRDCNFAVPQSKESL